jgi:hypothetical protein
VTNAFGPITAPCFTLLFKPQNFAKRQCVTGAFGPITAPYFTLLFEPRNFAKRQCKLQWLTPPIGLAMRVKPAPKLVVTSVAKMRRLKALFPDQEVFKTFIGFFATVSIVSRFWEFWAIIIIVWKRAFS